MKNFTMDGSGIDIVRKAQVYALAAHAAMRDVWAYTGEPYIVHLAAVAKRVAAIEDSTEDHVAAAWLCNVLGRTGCTSTDINMIFGADISGLVHEVNSAWARGEENAPAGVGSILCAEIISHCHGILSCPDRVCDEEWVKESVRVLSVVAGADPDILAEARYMVDRVVEGTVVHFPDDDDLYLGGVI
jgi:hypothetical protein